MSSSRPLLLERRTVPYLTRGVYLSGAGTLLEWQGIPYVICVGGLRESCTPSMYRQYLLLLIAEAKKKKRR